MRHQLILIGLLSVDVGRSFDIGNYNQARFDRFDGTCGGTKDLLIAFECDSMRFEKSGMLKMNGSLTVKKDIAGSPAFQVKLQRCKNKENLDSCEDFHSFRTDRFCQFAAVGEIWRPFFSRIEPKWGCPLRKGVYTLNDAQLDVSAFLLFPSRGWFWKARGEMLDGRTGKLLMCVIVETAVAVRRF